MRGKGWLQAAFVAASAALVLLLAPISDPRILPWAAAALNAVVGIIIGLAGLGAAALLDRTHLRVLIGALAGLLAGALTATMIVQFLPAGSRLADLRPVTFLFCISLGALVGASRGARFSVDGVRRMLQEEETGRDDKILDTSVIIDGRIADVCETGFLDGRIVIPQFVLAELQAVADSSDNLKRNRGRKGLDILQRLQRHPGLDVGIVEHDFPEIREVDQKLIALAKQLGAKIVTNDFNLNKVAQLHGIRVLNLNDLANSLKPVVLPGETMTVFILKEGKEERQGVAYLDDGTMVVVDNARNMLGKTIEVTITSVLQTTVGKMFFARFDPPGEATPIRKSPARDRAGE